MKKLISTFAFGSMLLFNLQTNAQDFVNYTTFGSYGSGSNEFNFPSVVRQSLR